MRGSLKHQVQQSQFLVACRDSITASKCSANTSIGILNPSTARGRVLSRCAMASSSSWLCTNRSVPLGKYSRIKPMEYRAAKFCVSQQSAPECQCMRSARCAGSSCGLSHTPEFAAAMPVECGCAGSKTFNFMSKGLSLLLEIICCG